MVYWFFSTAMSENEPPDFVIDIKAEGFAEDSSPVTEREGSLTRSCGYRKVLIQPSKDIGCGSYGSVVKAKLDNLPCAAKILHHTFFTSNDPNVVEFISRFKEECRILHKLKHPCIVQFLGVLEDPRHRRPILLMELMEQSLTQLLESLKKPLAYHVQVDITYDISLAIDYLHANGIQHRDISSNNILLTAGSRAKLTDFGMSKMVEINPRMSRNKQTACPGTLAYMPPEVLQPVPVYSDKIDVFSTGVLIIQIITQMFPTPTDPHTVVQDPKYKEPILVRVPELERRKSNLHGVYLTHPLRQLVLQCIQDSKRERPTAGNLCQQLVELMSAQNYIDSQSQYHQQIESLPLTRSALAMRDLEIGKLEREIKAFNQQKRSSWGGIFYKKDTSKLEAELSVMNLHKSQLVEEKARELEEDRKKKEYANENFHLKNEVKLLEQKCKQAHTEIGKLEKCVEQLRKEKFETENDQTELLGKIAELKRIINNHLQRNVEAEPVPKGEMATQSSQKQKQSISLPNLAFSSDEKIVEAERDIYGTKVVQLNLSELYQFLNVKTIIHQMAERGLDIHENVEDIEIHTSQYAQNLSAVVALVELQTERSLHFLFSLCQILETTGCPKQKQLAEKLKSDLEKQCSKRKTGVLQRFYPSLQNILKLELKVKDLQHQFLEALKVVIKSFEAFPVSLQRFCQFLSQLTLPGKKYHSVVDPETYKNAASTPEVFKAQASLWNCFSPHLLIMISEGCECPAAIQAIKDFTEVRSRFSSFVMSEQIYCLPEDRNRVIHQSSLHKYHSCPLSELQALYSNVFECIDEHKSTTLPTTIRITAEVDRPFLTLQDYDDITTAVCGYFHIPRVALVYAGCYEDGHVICWTTYAGLLPYLRGVPPSKGSDRLMAEQRIVQIAAGDLYYRCTNIQEVELFEASLYGLTNRVQNLVEQIASVDFVSKSGWTPLMVASFKGYADIVQILIEEKSPKIDIKDKNGWAALHLAALTGRVNLVKLLIKAQAKINIQAEDGQTALYIGSREGHSEVVELLLEQHADCSLCHKDGSTPLMIASYKGHADIVKKHIKAAIEQINFQREDGWTALHLAVHEGKIAVVKLLTDAHADVNAETEDGQTPLYIAIRKGHAAVMKILLQKYADIALCTKGDWTPLMAASFDGHTEVVQILLEAGVPINTQKEDGRTSLFIASARGHRSVVELLLLHFADVDICNKNGRTPLMVASIEGYVDIVKMLVERTHTINKQNEDGFSALHLTAQYGRADVVRVITEALAHLDIKTKDGRTALFIASEKGHRSVVELLLLHHADVDICSENGWTPLMAASCKGYVEVVKTLVEARTQTINRQNEDSSTALCLASKEGHTDVVSLLLQHGADHHICDKRGLTPFMIASCHGHKGVVRMLIEAKANVNQQTKDGWTALHLACNEGHSEIVVLLTNSLAQTDIQTVNGTTALFIASKKGNEDIVTLLIKNRVDVSLCKKNGWTPLMIAAFTGHYKIVELLMGADANIDTQDVVCSLHTD
jgi:ankyrin repeat protein/serine/threonine protein kinase